MNESEQNEKYANYLRNKIIKYFNLKSEDLELKYIKSILNSTKYDLYSSIYLLNESFFESNKNNKITINHVKKFTQDLVDSKSKFVISNVVENSHPQKLGDTKRGEKSGGGNNDGICTELKNKSIHNSIESIFKKYDGQPRRDKGNENDEKITKGINSKKKNKQKNDNANSENVSLSKGEKIQNKTNLNEKEADKKLLFDKLHNKNVKNCTAETKAKEDEHNKTISKQTEEKKETDYFSFFNRKENPYSLKEIIELIDNENVEKDNNNDKISQKKKKKNIQICTCNGKNHKIYANCLICGKLFCSKIKFKNCIFCDNPLYESDIINTLFSSTKLETKTNNMIANMKNSNPFLYKYYFDPLNNNLKKAISMRNKMLKNSINEDNTKIIDDSIDWFEDDIKHTLNIHDIHFSCYDDDTKNEIVNKYYDIFKKKITDINIDIDFKNLKISENVDYVKIKEFSEYLNEHEKKYQERKKKLSEDTPHNYLSNKEKKYISYVNDLCKMFLKNDTTKEDTNLLKSEKVIPIMEKKKYKYNMLNISDDEF
ncbi:conserved Plasmodium protein, unknown function [Plasmodium vinckei lentum]|uniref:TRIP4/RQT4 C2HC5-type zinc finger domain-containing protein n=1 Tax=Plasmodium vinckei lentum TaxID=138297 RepID=A0A6V7SR92_PLAVN|nr:conserved Plasmodium protein, unknown function [Plasmodium vinckei lentum]